MSSIPRDAHAIIIGAMRCGTTSLFNYLEGHPQICASRVKEPEFFSEHQAHGLDVERYEELWPGFDASRHRVALEASSGYTKRPREQGVAARMHACGIRPKLIYLVRNPIDRIVSHYNFVRLHLGEDEGLSITDEYFIAVSSYYWQLKAYRRHFPARDLLVLTFEEMTQRPRVALRRVLCHLGVADDYVPEGFEAYNKTAPVSVGDHALRQSALGATLRRLPTPIKRAGRRALRSMMPSARKEVTPEECAYLRGRLEPDMARLGAVYGVDVEAWSFDRAAHLARTVFAVETAAATNRQALAKA